MARAIWSGSISFGLVNVPVKVYTAVRNKEVRFNMLHDRDGGRIRQKRVCTKDGEEVPYEHIVKGFEVSPDRYVVLSPKELEAFEPEASRAIDIQDFVSLEDIDPIFWEHTYYLVPDRGAERAYALLHQAMRNTGKVGIARTVLRTRQYLCTIRPIGDVLAMSTMQYSDEVVPQEELEGVEAVKAQKPAERELEMAQQLIQALGTRFEPEKYRDEYREKVLELIERKAQGEEIVAAPEARRAPAQVVDLMEALRASLRSTGQAQAPEPEQKGERRHRAQAARTTRRRKRSR